MTVGNEIETTRGVPEPIGIHLTPGGAARDTESYRICTVVASAMARVSRSMVSAMLAIMFVRAESDAERAVELLHQRHALRRQRRGGLTRAD